MSVDGIEQINVLNPVPLSFSNTLVLTASKFHPAADGILKNFNAVTEPDGTNLFN